MVQRVVKDEFGEDVDVLVQSNGRVFIRESDSSYDSPDCIVEDKEALYEALRDVEFEFEQSSYVLTDGEEQDLIGATFYLHRDGW
jgi:hypothetical protein